MVTLIWVHPKHGCSRCRTSVHTVDDHFPSHTYACHRASLSPDPLYRAVVYCSLKSYALKLRVLGFWVWAKCYGCSVMEMGFNETSQPPQIVLRSFVTNL